MNGLPTSTSAQFLLPIFVLMYTDSAWNGLLSPANIIVLHRKSFRPSVRSCLLQAVNHFGKKSWKQLLILTRFLIFKRFIELSYMEEHLHAMLVCQKSNMSITTDYCRKAFSNNLHELHKQTTKRYYRII